MERTERPLRVAKSRAMPRLLALFLTIALLGAGPKHKPGTIAPGDRLAELAGTWTCRNPAGTVSKVVYSAASGGVTADETAPGAPAEHMRFTPDSIGGWHVERTYGDSQFTGHAPTWNADPWIVASTTGQAVEIRYEHIDDRTLRRTFATANGPAYAGEICAKGDAPPDAALCAVRDIPPFVTHAMEPDPPLAAMENHVTGLVQVVVSLDAAGHVVDAAIKQSPSAVLDKASLAAARQSTYRPALHDCKPVPSQYVFSVEYGGG